MFSPATPDASIELTGVGYDSQGGGVVVDGAPAQRATHPHIALVMEIGSVCNNADWEAQVRVLPLLVLLLRLVLVLVLVLLLHLLLLLVLVLVLPG